jgi:hypothetical protein
MFTKSPPAWRSSRNVTAADAALSTKSSVVPDVAVTHASQSSGVEASPSTEAILSSVGQLVQPAIHAIELAGPAACGREES